MKTQVGVFIVGLMTVAACTARAQEVPPVLPTPVPPATTAEQARPVPQQAPPVAEATQVVPTAAAPEASPAPRMLTPEELRERRSAIFLMEGVLVNAVRLAAGNTAEQIQAVQPVPLMFTSAPARAHGSYLEGYGVFFHVEIPSVMPSVTTLLETLERERMRQSNPAQQTSLAGSATSPAALNPDAHYVESVKRQLINAMLDHSNALDLSADEWLTVAAREAQETPGQIAQPSTLILRVRGSDLADFMAKRLTREEVRKRVQVRGF